MWKAFQIFVLVTFLFSNVYFEWGIEGIAAGVMGAMLAYYLTLVVIALRGWWTGEPTGLAGTPQWRLDAGRRLAERKASRSRDKIARGGS